MADVNPIPDGFRTVTPYLVVPNGVEAIEFYSTAFGAEETMRMEGPGGSTLHAEIRIGDSMVMLTDENPQFGLVSPQTLGNNTASIHLCVENVDAAFQKAIDAGCEVLAPVTDMFWGDRFGKLKDPFGHAWSIATKVEDVPADELQQRAEDFFKQMMSGGPCEGDE